VGDAASTDNTTLQSDLAQLCPNARIIFIVVSNSLTRNLNQEPK